MEEVWIGESLLATSAELSVLDVINELLREIVWCAVLMSLLQYMRASRVYC
ncbi:hypothetical protein IG631_17675 [Alternaria alternata]|nr:hypothetical protein IG631_17675 [Alternaria alternata]